MGTRKRGSELVFNLQWRNKLDNGGEKSNIIGMYDTPTTTSNFEMFKSYLLKNSGVAGNDVKVTYVTDNGQEWIIDSQEWFEIALSAFRLKARLGEVIFLKLDRISNGKNNVARKHSNDVETQFNVDSMDNTVVAPPEWFVAYMKQFKKDMVEEVIYAVSSNLSSNPKEKENIQIAVTNLKKVKPESSKRSRKHFVLGETPIDKEFLKTFKFDRKLEHKLDKLDAKTKRIKEQKQALMNRFESGDHKYSGKFSFVPTDEHDIVNPSSVPILEKEEYSEIVNKEVVTNKNAPDEENVETPVDADRTQLLNASLANTGKVGTSEGYEQFIGGEIYFHTWEIVNTGKLSWSSNTELRLTWGSANLIPSVKSLRCPSLKPGEKGTISVRFEIPVKPGTYESYWNFYDKNVRFGHTLSFCVLVELPLSSIIPGFLDESIKKSQHPQKPKVLENLTEQDDTSKPLLNPDSARKIKIEASKQAGKVVIYATGSPDDKQFEKILLYPNGVTDDSQPISLSLPKNAERLLYFPNGVNESNPLKISLKRISETEPRTEELTEKSKVDKRITPNLTETNLCYLTGINEDKEKFAEKVSPPPEQNEAVNISQVNKPNVESPSKLIFYPVGLAEEACEPDNENAKMNCLGFFSTQNQSINEEKFCIVEESEQVKKENASELTVMNLSAQIEDIKLTDSDSDWDVDFETDFPRRPSNKYGISKKDLIIDLSKTTKTKEDESENTMESGQKENEVIQHTSENEDNNNNNGSYDNNNCSEESISEIASDTSSDLSSGYDVLQVPLCDEKEESSGYVYITIDGNKLSVPKYILRPDFLTNAEQAPAPTTLDDEKTIDKEEPVKEQETIAPSKLESQDFNINKEENILEKSATTHCSASGSCFSDANAGRLFIFPQSHPGFEVVAPTNWSFTSADKEETIPISPSQNFAWWKHERRYSANDFFEGKPAHLGSDPYGPLGYPRSASQAGSTASNCNPTPKPEQPTFLPTSPNWYSHNFNSPEGSASYHLPQSRHPHDYQHVPNFQQVPKFRPWGPKPCHLSPMKETPSAPPRQQAPDHSPGHGGPVHILPENLVNGAVNVASSAINTARSVINMIVPNKTEPGRWINGHWVTENPESLRAKNLCILAEMGFWDADLNATLLARYNDDITRVVSELVQ